MFLRPRYASVQEKKNRPKAVGVGDLSSSLLDTLFDSSSRVFFEAAACGLQCKVMQIAPMSGE
jgi:hypothetical protein